MNVDGGCLCGAIEYQAVVDPERCAICHCQNCQVNSGTAFGWIVHIQDHQFELISGRLTALPLMDESRGLPEVCDF